MKILEKAKTSDGLEIQLEKWDEELHIGAYPLAKGSTLFVLFGEKFRLTIAANSFDNYLNEQVKQDFEALKNGTKRLEDLANRFWFPRRDKFLLGLEEKGGTQ